MTKETLKFVVFNKKIHANEVDDCLICEKAITSGVVVYVRGKRSDASVPGIDDFVLGYCTRCIDNLHAAR